MLAILPSYRVPNSRTAVQDRPGVLREQVFRERSVQDRQAVVSRASSQSIHSEQLVVSSSSSSSSSNSSSSRSRSSSSSNSSVVGVRVILRVVIAQGLLGE